MNDLPAIVKRLAHRGQGRSEATIQSDIRQFLLTAPFDLEDDQVDAPLEVPVGDGRRIDIEVGFTVIEVKKDLRKAGVLEAAKKQLAGYVATRTEALDQVYIGVLTDGCEWVAMHLDAENEPLEVTRFELNPNAPDADGLVVWLEGVLATTSQVTPTPREILSRLGAESSAHSVAYATLRELYERGKDQPSVKLKRQLWSKLLTTALGTHFEDTDDLFIEHTLLVISAETIAHAVVGFELADLNPASLITGSLFSQSQINGVVEADFFDWVIEVPDGVRFVRALARRVGRFSWANVEHDVMKVLYESIIDADRRKKLGEYYTPDWLAHRVVAEVLDEPLEQTALDPACGSGTFVFHLVRRCLDAAKDLSVAEQIRLVTSRVFGMDIHPVAVTLARVTYLLAIGRERLQHTERPPMTIPVFLGDALQWSQQADIFDHGMLKVSTAGDSPMLFPQDLKFPAPLLTDVSAFDRLVGELADKASAREKNAPVPSLAAVFRRYAVADEDQAVVEATFKLMCELHDEGRNHIWGYYVRNVARPTWFAQEPNQVDRLVGNPPWLSFRFMTKDMQELFKEMSSERGLWHGATVATHQDLSGLFYARTIELYLKKGGKCAYVLPEATLSRKQHKGFRTGAFRGAKHDVKVRFERPWSLHKVKPSFFPVPACVVFAERATSGSAVPLSPNAVQWAGKLPTKDAAWAEVKDILTRSDSESAAPNGEHASPYKDRFSNGATVFPRVLLHVEAVDAGPLGAGAGRTRVRSYRSKFENKPWKDVATLEGSVESPFVLRILLGESIVAYRVVQHRLAIVPWDGEKLVSYSDSSLDLYPGLARWWREAEALWQAHRSSDRLSLTERLDYHHGLSQQFPIGSHRVVYTKSGMYLAATRVTDPRCVVENVLYWGAVSSEEEALFVTAILNSPVTTEMVRPLQARGEHNPRHFDKYIWKLPIPKFDPDSSEHQALAALGREAEAFVGRLDLPESKRFETVRRFVRDALAESDVGQDIDGRVRALLKA